MTNQPMRLSYKGYIADVSLDLEAGVLHGEIANARAVLTFSAVNVSDLQTALQDTVEDYFEWCRERNVAPEKPYSGTLSLRLTPELHRAAADGARACGLSVNAFITHVIEHATCSGADRLVVASGAAVWERARPKAYVSHFLTLETEDQNWRSPSGEHAVRKMQLRLQ